MAYLGKYETRTADFKVYTSSTATATHTLSWTPTSKQSLRITINGVVQQDDAFSLTGNTVTLDAAILVTDVLEIVGVNELGGQVLVPADGSIQTGKLGDNSVTLAKMAGGTDGNLITYDTSGDPAYVATGTATHVLTSNGAGAAPTFQAAAGGLTHASQWRLTTNFSNDAAPIDANLEEVDAPVGFGVLGSSMTESSGIFTFPTTGYWLIHFHASWSVASNSQWNLGWITTTTDNATYAQASEFNQDAHLSGASPIYPSGDCFYIFDVTDTTQCKCRFDIDVQQSATVTEGNTDRNKTYMTFLRLADRP